MSAQPAAPRPADPTPADAVVPGARSLVRRTLRPILSVWLRMTVEGLGHVPDDGPVIIASTHQSHGDSLALGVAIERPVHFLGDVRLTHWPVLGPWLPKVGMVPLRRGSGDADAMDHLATILAAGGAIAVYPEGSRSRDGRVHRLRSGVARLAAATGAPVVPAAVAGIYDVWPINGRPRLRGGRVTVRFGAPLAPPDATPRDRRRFNDHLQATLAALAGVDTADDFSPIGGGTG
jgi:1-acyl-sn-glycerol-3-phosphate acyltransferase